MNVYLIDMKKNLKQVDPVYNSVTSYMSTEDRIKYCSSLIKETEEFLNTTVRPMDDKTKEKYITLISAAREEMELLRRKN